MINLFKKYLLVLLILIFSEKANALPNIYNATYSLQKNGIEFGHSVHSSSYDSESNEWCLRIDSYTVGIFSIKKDNRSEMSCFYYNKNKYLEILNNRSAANDFAKTNTYIFSRVSSKKNQIIKNRRINNLLITSKDGKTTTHGADINIDRLVAQSFGYAYTNVLVNDKGREREYKFEILGKDTIDSPFGLTEALIVKKDISQSKRSTITWYSIENNYIPIVIEQYRLDKLKVTAKLISLEQ
jgi:fumarate reductase subunit C